MNDAGWEGWATRLRAAITEAVERRATEAILLSGGLDTSILAVLLAVVGKPVAVTVLLENAPRPDEPFALELANSIGLEHHLVEVGEARLELAIRSAVESLKSFDPMTIRNQAVIAVGLDRVVELGLRSAMTGDGADELFAGYSFYHDLEPKALHAALRTLWSQMGFDSLPMGEKLGLRMEAPYLVPEIRSLAEEVDPRWLVGEYEGGKLGKWLLRKAFETELPPHFVWRRKDPIEVGSGASILPERYRHAIREDEFKEAAERYRRDHGVRLRDPEHLHYFEAYLELHGPPAPGEGAPKLCPDCRGGLELARRFCKRCGAYPV